SPRPSWCGSLPPAPRRRPPCRASPSSASSLGWRPWPSPETTNAPAQGGAGREKRTRSVASLVLLRGPPAAAGPSIHRGVDDQRSSVEPCREYVTGFGSPAAGRDNVGSLGLTSPDLCSIGIDRLPTRGKSAGPPKRGCGRQASWTPWRISDTRTSTRTTRADRKSTRLNSSHVKSSYAVFCLKKKI